MQLLVVPIKHVWFMNPWSSRIRCRDSSRLKCQFRTLCKALATASGAFDMLPCNDLPWITDVPSTRLPGLPKSEIRFARKLFASIRVKQPGTTLSIAVLTWKTLSDFHSSPGPHSSSQNGYCTNYQESSEMGVYASRMEVHNRFQVSYSFSTLWCMGFLLKSGQTCDERPRKNRSVTTCHIS